MKQFTICGAELLTVVYRGRSVGAKAYWAIQPQVYRSKAIAVSAHAILALGRLDEVPNNMVFQGESSHGLIERSTHRYIHTLWIIL